MDLENQQTNPEDDLLKALGGDVEETTEAAEEVSEPDVEEAPERYTLTIDGETEEVPLDELVRRAQMAGAADRRLEEAKKTRAEAIAERDRILAEAKAKAGELGSHTEDLSRALEVAKAVLGEAPKEPTVEDYDRDPIAAGRQLQLVRAHEQRMRDIAAQQEKLAAQRSAQAQESLKQVQQREAALFIERHPSLDQKADTARIARQFQKLGRDPQQLLQIGEGRADIMTMALKAEKYDELMQKQGKTTPSKADQPKTLKPGTAKAPQSSKSRNRDEALAAMKKTGSRTAAENLLLSAMKG